MIDELESLKQQLQDALSEIDKLREENARLKQTTTPPISTSVIKPKVKVHQPPSAPSQIHSQSPVEEKFLYSHSFSVAEKTSIQNVGNQKTTILDIHRFAAMNGILHTVTNLT